jgi:L,D-transpeptidase YcbB
VNPCARAWIGLVGRSALAALLVAAGASYVRAEDAIRLRAGIASAIESNDILDSRGLRESLRAIYARRGGKPLWVDHGSLTPQARALLIQLRSADAYGLEPRDYPSEGEVWDGTEARAAQLDVALSVAALRFVSDLHYGRIDPRQAGFALDAPRARLDLPAVVEELATARDPGRVLSAVQPQFLHYRLLLGSLSHYRELATRPGLTDLPAPRRKLKLGDVYEGTPALRKLLVALGDLPEASVRESGQMDAAQSSPGMRVDASLVAGIRHFQTRHGLEADGVLGKATYAALTTPMAQRVRQIELTLERWRWLPAFDTPPIIVNIPQFRLFAFETTQDLKASIVQMDVIVGKTYSRFQTPVFAADMRYVVFRPYWDIPYSIMLHEMLPHIRANAAYIAQQHLEIVAGQTDAAKPMPPTAANIEALARGELRLRQQPGPDNALGLIKFMLPNHYNVYLHSTPAHNLFKEPRRAFSHGCIRVSDPLALAEHVLRNAPGEWSRERIEAAMNGTTTQRVNLTKPIRVMILYGTVLATESGDVLFFDDIYRNDRKLERLLSLEPVT